MTDAETKVIGHYSVGGARVDLQNSQYADQPDFWREVNQHFNAGKSVDLVHYRCDRQVRPFGNLLTRFRLLLAYSLANYIGVQRQVRHNRTEPLTRFRLLLVVFRAS